MDKYKSDEIVKIIPTDNSEFFAILGVDNITDDVGFEYIPPKNDSLDEHQVTISPGDLVGFNIQNNIDNSENSNVKFVELPAMVKPIDPNERIVRYGLLEEDRKQYNFFSWLNGKSAIL